MRTLGFLKDYKVTNKISASGISEAVIDVHLQIKFFPSHLNALAQLTIADALSVHLTKAQADMFAAEGTGEPVPDHADAEAEVVEDGKQLQLAAAPPEEPADPEDLDQDYEVVDDDGNTLQEEWGRPDAPDDGTEAETGT